MARHKYSARTRFPQSQKGVGLLEVLIAVLIMAIGMLGIAALQATALRNSESSLERSQAVIQTYAILDAMRANASVARIGGYNLNVSTCNAPEDSGTLVAGDLHDWIESLHASLGESACGKISCDSDTCKITVQWDDSRAKNMGDSEDAPEDPADPFEVVMETRL